MSDGHRPEEEEEHGEDAELAEVERLLGGAQRRVDFLFERVDRHAPVLSPLAAELVLLRQLFQNL